MALKIGITNYSFNHSLKSGKMTIESFLDFCGKAKFDGVDLMSYFWKDKEAEMANLPKWLERNRLKLVGYGIGNNFLTHDPAKLQEAKDAVRSGVQDAHRIGAKMMRVFGGHDPKGWTFDSALNHIAECYKELIKMAEDNDVVLTVENHGGVPGIAEEVIRLIKAVDSPYLASLFDTGNWIGSGTDPVASAKMLAPYVRHVHVKDVVTFPLGSDKGWKAGRADLHIDACTVGKGIVPNQEAIRALAAGGYSGYLSLEAEGPPTEDEGERVLASLANLRKYVAAVKK
jgi:sugar phosphate isomerase/epimerase